nr:3711_t:CDS:2 [Entrophospora candida]
MTSTNQDQDRVPLLSINSLSQIYDSINLPDQIIRYQAFIQKFQSLYNKQPSFIVRSPGRVNIIGEHIDYAGFGVLPMAISRDLLIAVYVVEDESSVKLANVDNEKYKTRTWEFEGDNNKIVEIKLEDGVVEWSNYFKCGYKGIIKYLGLEKPKGMYCLVDGSIPPGSGLSSSSAFVCSAVLATSYANGTELSRKQITEISIDSERLAGVNSGGMDQTASIFSLFGHALYIQFLPALTATPIKLPSTSPPMAFIVANSLVTADKIATAPTGYNLRVFETRVAAYHLGLSSFGKECDILKEVSDLYTGHYEVSAINLRKLSEYVDQIYGKKDGYTIEDLTELLNLSIDEIYDKFQGQHQVKAEKFQLYKRSKHVFEEALRVLKFYEICNSGGNSEKLFEILGGLMNESHQSCKDLFDCSSAELDELVGICLAGGAYGSRLTGAGWGGCTVSLIKEDQTKSFIQYVTENYYKKNFPNITEKEIEDAIFATRPGSGA